VESLIRFISISLQNLLAVAVGLALALGIFLLLPLLESITSTPQADLIVQSANTANLPPPPPPPPEEEKPEEEEEKPEEPPPPDLAEETPPLDLSQLELALNVGAGGGVGAFQGDFAVKLPVGNEAASKDEASDVDALFSIADLDQKPRVMYQPGPNMTGDMRKQTPGTVYILFVVDQRGRVENPVVQTTTNPIFDSAALSAVKQWRFEPGKRNGEAVKFRMRVPITFPKPGK
jgi:protein TonB